MKWRFWSPRNRPQTDTCATIEPMLSLYSDGMASPDEVSRLEAHLDRCADCRRALTWMQATHHVISMRPAASPPANLRARIAQAIAEADELKTPPIPVRRPRVLRPAFVMAASAAIAACGIVLDHSLTPPRGIIVTPSVRVSQAPIPESVPSPTVAPSVRRSPSEPERVAVRRHQAPPSTISPLAVKQHPLGPLVARTPGNGPADTPPGKALPPPAPRPIPHPVEPTLTAKTSGLKTSPSGTHPAPVRPPMIVAERPTVPVPRDHPGGVLTAPALPSLPAPAAIEAGSPEPSRIEVAASVPVHSGHQDILNGVRMSLATLRSAHSDWKVARDTNARVQTTSYNTGGLNGDSGSPGKFVQLPPGTYTPTFLPDSK